jgi:hypothetical protein
MKNLKIKTTTLLETEFTVPKYFKIAHHYHMILNDENYLFVKSKLDNHLLVYPEISIGQITWSSSRWHDSQVNQQLIEISEQEFRDEYTKANVLLLNFLN